MDTLDSKTIIQIGLIVPDVEAAARHYAQVFGIPMPQIVGIADDAFAKTDYRGGSSSATGRAAFFDLGSLQVELIQPVGGPSTWADFLNEHGPGIHHFAVKTEDMAEAVNLFEKHGMPRVQSGGWDGGQYAYIDSVRQLGTMIELLHFDR
jgi:methylmalonyl-CoA/ethylmalonyl-CoA epimerase